MWRQRVQENIRSALGGWHSYTRERLPRVAEDLTRDYEIDALFDALPVVGLKMDPDDLSFEDLFGDMFDEEIHGDSVNLRQLRAEKKRAERTLEIEGQWAYCSYYVGADGDIYEVDCISGFVGDSLFESGYAPDLQLAAIEAAFKHYFHIDLPPYNYTKTGEWMVTCLDIWNMASAMHGTSLTQTASGETM